jgi:arabinose-5-phosphate isomerase
LIEKLRSLKEMVAAEAAAVTSAASQISTEAVRAAEWTAACHGAVIVTGIGKAGLVGQKLVATLASTGTPAHFLHPAEAIHGDLGRVRGIDLVWAISNSGRSEEVVRIASHLRENSSGLISLTADEDNPLAVAADCAVAIGRHPEVGANGLAPTSSTAVMMAVGDAIALLASQLRRFTPQDFARFHPGGALGQKLAQVDQVMRPLEACRVVSQSSVIRDAMVATATNGRRSGAIMLTDDQGCLCGIFTDSDLARLLEARCDGALDEAIGKRMTANPTTAASGSMLGEAIATMSRLRISELPVVNQQGRPLGLLDITDLIALGAPVDGPATIPLNR